MEINYLKEFRKELHKYPEVSGREKETSERIQAELKKFNPDEIIGNLGGNGVLAKFLSKSGKAEKTLLFRAELDAIPVQEESDFEHKSEHENVMHGCGHDGHMTILIGVASLLHENRPENTDVYLLFQPAEETGEGAGWILDDERFKNLDIDYAFALHNLPGYTAGSVVTKPGLFAAASTGVEITFKGESSHAAYPEQGINPSTELVETVLQINKILQPFREKDFLNKAVNTFIKLGEPAYGVSPGIGRAGFTLRSGSDEELEDAVDAVRNFIEKQSKLFKGELEFRLVEPFTATVNDPDGVEIVKKSAKTTGLNVVDLEKAFPWSEDFGAFREKCPISIFGLGSGESSPHLHSEKYDFNDELLEPGIRMFMEIIRQFSNTA